MKRSGPQLFEPSARKQRVLLASPKMEEIPFKLRLLKNWKITPEASRFLKNVKEF